MVKYVSTRGSEAVNAAEAIKNGIAMDGGLYVPDSVENIAIDWIQFADWQYAERAAFILGHFLPDYSADELKNICQKAYGAQFDDTKVAPVKLVGDKAVLELWHGPTSAFKDMALQVLPRLLTSALNKTATDKTAVILTATSGDTGKAALAGFADVGQTKIMVFYPDNGTSEIQRLQMATQKGDNVNVVAVKGNFDDCQTGVKNIFANQQMAMSLSDKGYFLSSANSINWGRLVPQIVYYFSAYSDLLTEKIIERGQSINFVVPTGNFGNILAGYLAKRCGLPINRFICAANSNNILHDFIECGEYDCRREFMRTVSPSMDILVSSNLERLLYFVAGSNSTKMWMNELARNKHYRVDEDTLKKIQNEFASGWADEEETMATIRRVWQESSYLLDPHTAVAWRVAEKIDKGILGGKPVVILSTANPYKFNEAIHSAICENMKISKDEFSLMNDIAAVTGWQPPHSLFGLKNAKQRFTKVCSISDMSQQVREWL